MIESESSPHWPALREAVIGVARELAQAIVRDGEGATKFITVKVGGGGTVAECRQVAYAIGHSPLVKTAFFASIPTSVASLPPSAMPVSTISTQNASRYGSAVAGKRCWFRKTAPGECLPRRRRRTDHAGRGNLRPRRSRPRG